HEPCEEAAIFDPLGFAGDGPHSDGPSIPSSVGDDRDVVRHAVLCPPTLREDVAANDVRLEPRPVLRIAQGLLPQTLAAKLQATRRLALQVRRRLPYPYGPVLPRRAHVLETSYAMVGGRKRCILQCSAVRRVENLPNGEGTCIV